MHSSPLQLPSKDFASGNTVQCPSSQVQGQQELQVASNSLLSLHLSDSNCSQRRWLLAGLADPGPVAAALWTDAELGSAVCLDSIVTVVDARNICRQLTEKRPEGAVNEAQQQIAYADVILLNKVKTLYPGLGVFRCCMLIINGRCCCRAGHSDGQLQQHCWLVSTLCIGQTATTAVGKSLLQHLLLISSMVACKILQTMSRMVNAAGAGRGAA